MWCVVYFFRLELSSLLVLLVVIGNCVIYVLKWVGEFLESCLFFGYGWYGGVWELVFWFGLDWNLFVVFVDLGGCVLCSVDVFECG